MKNLKVEFAYVSISSLFYYVTLTTEIYEGDKIGETYVGRHVECMWEVRKAYKNLIGNSEHLGSSTLVYLKAG
jgi:hypothetical protein